MKHPEHQRTHRVAPVICLLCWRPGEPKNVHEPDACEFFGKKRSSDEKETLQLACNPFLRVDAKGRKIGPWHLGLTNGHI
jgi:hypothetical protein